MTGHLYRFVKGDIADKFRLWLARIIEAFFRRGHPIDTDIYDTRTGLDPIALDHFGNANSGDENIRAPAQARQVARARMGNANGAILAEQ